MIPDYRDGSIVNLVASIQLRFGSRPAYGPLKILPQESLKSRNVVLMVVDGLGHRFLESFGRDSFMWRHNIGPITSVFPSTTASAVTSFLTGVAPQQHAVTGWYMYLKEMGVVATTLLMEPRYGGSTFTNIRPEDIFHQRSIFGDLNVLSYSVTTRQIGKSGYNGLMAANSKFVYYRDMAGMFGAVRKLVKSKGKKFIHAYWPEHDKLHHHHSSRDRRVLNHLRQLDRRFELFIRSIRGTDTTVILTADHGLIDIPKGRTIRVKDHPKFAECLTLPICGEPRLCYCYVRPSKARQFESYVRREFKNCCSLYKSDYLIKKGYFGLGKPHSSLFDRVGDYILVPKKDYCFLDTLLGEDRSIHKGRHGGTSDDEMLVPLVVVKT
jgi:hypothetical protein